ncbi:MAG: hypothetical protein HFJ03_03995 [Lachnospira sp.]|jgi:hypothetical protein|nr:hypothetical protein [Lachnospira sp.]
MNNMKTITILWSIALLCISIATLIYAGSNIAGIKLPDVCIRILGIVELIALPVLAYTSIKKFKK